ncbi:MAG: cytochrome ubiquinol oxidase subunit I [Gammaproteobacteria bacterium]
MNPDILSRIQFGITIGFHIIFPTLNIGLATFLVIMEGLWLKTRNTEYLKICKFWTKIFALTFGMGVVSGVFLSYELGTNFNRFSEAFGGVLGPLFNYEVLSAFFLEAGFLGIMMFGWNRVKPKVHFSATLLVAVGTTISAFWIMSANSWMQTPAGYYIQEGRYIIDNWTQAIFNPSFIPRFIHMLMSSYISASFFIAGVSAWYIIKNQHTQLGKIGLKFAIIAALILMPIQIFMGDLVGLEVHHNQPLKTAAMEANWVTQPGAPLVLFALPDAEHETNRYEISIPYLASLINTHSLNGVLTGLDSAPKADRPPILPVFFGFRIMVGIGLFLLLVAGTGVLLLARKKLFKSQRFLKLLMYCVPLGFIATIFGWITAEIGRQPWAVYHLMRTNNATTVLPWTHVWLSLTAITAIYLVIFGFYLYYLSKLIRKGPKDITEDMMLISYIPLPGEEPPIKRSFNS